MLSVTMAILSVDLPPIFRRSLCKTEEYGLGLMDCGVALITLNSGMSGRKARPWIKIYTFSQLMEEVNQTMLGVIVPICVGFLRILFLSELNYQEHPSEWGTHWNFYTTVAIINVVQSFLVSSRFAIPIAMTMIVTYQMVLQQTELEEFVFFAEREDFVSANREGLLSLIGYVSLQFIGVGLGRFVYSQMMEEGEIAGLMQDG